jgi:hypothetical protein
MYAATKDFFKGFLEGIGAELQVGGCCSARSNLLMHPLMSCYILYPCSSTCTRVVRIKLPLPAVLPVSISATPQPKPHLAPPAITHSSPPLGAPPPG